MSKAFRQMQRSVQVTRAQHVSRHIGRRFVAVAALAAAVAFATPSSATVESDLATAENSYAALDYSAALSAAEAVLAQKGLGHDVLTRASRVAALAHAALGHGEQAKQQFILMLQYDPDFKVDSKLGPRFTEPFAEAKGYWQAQGRRAGMDVQAAVQFEQQGEIRVTTRDPLGIVKRISSGHRWAPRREFTVAEVELGKPIEVAGNPPGATRLEYYVRAVDAKGNAVFEDGTPEIPKNVIVTEPVRAAGAEEKKGSFFTSPAFLIVGGVLIAGAAVGGFFALRPTEFTTPTTGRGVVGATCGNARCD